MIATAPALLILAAFKIFMCRPLEKQFRYYTPSSEEVEAEWANASQEKRTHHSEMEQRFLHPALQSNELFTVSLTDAYLYMWQPFMLFREKQVMVHKAQEGLAREVLSEYPWFNQSPRDGGLRIKAVKEVIAKNPTTLIYEVLTALGYTGKSGIRSHARWNSQRSRLGYSEHRVDPNAGTKVRCRGRSSRPPRCQQLPSEWANGTVLSQSRISSIGPSRWLRSAS